LQQTLATMGGRLPVIIHSESISQVASSSFPDLTNGNAVWQTLFSDSNASSDAMCAGIATCPPNGWLALHQHTQPEMYYVLAGSGQVEVEGVRHSVTEGSAIWIPGDAMHGVFCGPNETLKWLYVFPEGHFENIKYRFKVT